MPLQVFLIGAGALRKRDQIDRWYRGCDPLLEKNLAKRQGLFEVRRLRAVPVHSGSSVYFWW